MKKDRKKWSWIGLAVLLAILPLRAAADDELKASQSTIADPSKGLFYQSTFDTQKTDLPIWMCCFSLQKTAGLTGYIFLCLDKQRKNPLGCRPFACMQPKRKILRIFPI